MSDDGLLPDVPGPPATPSPSEEPSPSPKSRATQRPKRGQRVTKQKGDQQKAKNRAPGKLKRKRYEKDLYRLQVDLCRLQSWVQEEGLRVAVLFEGRDAAGKGGVIKRITELVSPRVFRVVALPAPSDREKSQFYYQRYIAHLPSAGEIVLFDRSWYNRAGVERVMGFCTDEEYERFLKTVSGFEGALVDSGLILIKYWFEVSQEEQERRFRARIKDPTKHWKLSPMDLESMRRWYDYSRAKDAIFAATDTPHAPWCVVRADVKRRARLNCIADLLSKVPHQALPTPKIKLPKRQKPKGYEPPRVEYNWVPEEY
jgi:polyphosphate kinase 2